MNRVFWPLAACLMLAGCGGDSSLNPLRWFGGGKAAPRATDSLAPKGGYEGTEANRLPVAQVLTARWEPTVEGDLPSWCNLTKNQLVNWYSEDSEKGRKWSFLVSKGPFAEAEAKPADPAPTARPRKQRKKVQMEITQPVIEPVIPTEFPDITQRVAAMETGGESPFRFTV